MTAARVATEYRSGFCVHGRHDHCRGDFGTACCCCPCHDEPEPEPEPPPLLLLTVGARVVCAPGTTWANQDLSGAVLEIVEVHPYGPELGGPLFVCRWPGTTISPAYGAVLGRDKLEPTS